MNTKQCHDPTVAQASSPMTASRMPPALGAFHVQRSTFNAPRSTSAPAKLVWLSAVGLVLLAGAALLYWFPPGTVWFYPRCVFHQMTGLSCPGCGGLRAAHQLLHGHVQEAFALNPLLLVLLPVLGWLVWSQLWRLATGRELRPPLKHPAWLWMLFAAVIGFGIVRNLPMAPFQAIP